MTFLFKKSGQPKPVMVPAESRAAGSAGRQFSTLTGCLLLLLSLMFSAPAPTFAGHFSFSETDSEGAYRLTGRVTDAETGEGLPAVNIQVEGTFRGAITNNDGFFDFPVNELPAVLIFRYIGYETRSVSFTSETADQLVALNPSAIELEELVFTGEDPANHIMERVILRKQMWQEQLENWRADAYTRTSLSNNEGIVSISESLTQTWWKRGEGFREYMIDQRQTSNLLEDQNFAGTRNLPNFYDDEIEIAGFRVIGVTHPNAFRYYDFRVEGRRYIGNQMVWDIRVIPKTRLQPVFEGTVSVLGDVYALLEVDLVPGEMIFFPPPIQEFGLRYRQQFSNYGGDFWLPVDVRINGLLEIGFPGFRIPEIRFDLVSSIREYEVNIAVPDSVFGTQRRFTRLSEPERARLGRSFEIEPEAIPLSEAERLAYETIDSTQTISDAFQPTGFLARIAGEGAVQTGPPSRRGFVRNTEWRPQLRFNRAEEIYAGLNPRLNIIPELSVEALFGYGTGSEDFTWGGAAVYRFPQANRRLSLRAAYTTDTRARIPSQQLGFGAASAAMLLGFDDYFDYYRSERFALTATYFFRRTVLENRLRLQAGFISDTQRSMPQVTSYSFRGGVVQRPNAPIEEGQMRSLTLNLRLGDDPAPFGIAGSSSALVQFQHSSEDLLGSDFTFTRINARVDFRIETMFRRRFLANTLDLRLQGFTHSGDLPVQAFGGFDSRLSLFTPFGGFRTAGNRIVEGEHGAALFWEHNFRGVPFELIGLRRVARSGIGILVHGASGRTWIGDDRLQSLPFEPFYEGRWRHEAGIALNGLFSIARLDASWRLDRPGFFAGISVARVF
ncbi:MAG: carboxypeptidase-like regulatory domain-containing protein [Balneolales bacterium]|nr:carboxypeptidase-like regulatory domain-containing protein [Balneolales bacterium]